MPRTVLIGPVESDFIDFLEDVFPDFEDCLVDFLDDCSENVRVFIYNKNLSDYV